MKVVYVPQRFSDESEPSIFLAGPSPRRIEDGNWRPSALRNLEMLNFKGAVFVPLTETWGWVEDEKEQYLWEIEHLEKASVIVFWVPRDLRTLPGFTTNIEWGKFFNSGRSILGYPEGTPKMGYMRQDAKQTGVPIFHTLQETLGEAVCRCM